MKRLLLLLLGGFISCGLMTGCLESVPLEVRVNQTYNGQAITLQQGQELVIDLERDSSAARTHTWRIVSGGMQVFGEPATKTLESQHTIVDRYTFTALFVGSDQLRMEEQSQQNGGAGGADNRVFTLNITVTK